MERKLDAVRKNYSLKNKRTNLFNTPCTSAMCKTNKKEEKNIEQSGITLISLAVTIIVIIIIASISVSALYGDNRNYNKRKAPTTFSRNRIN